MIGLNTLAELQKQIALFDDEPAYKRMFFLFYGPLVRFAATFVSSHQSAEEVVSDVFMKVWERRKTLGNVANLRLYLYVSTKNTCLNHIGKEKKNEQVESLHYLSTDFPATAPDPEQLLITAEMMRRINSAINELPPRCKLIYKLIREDRLPYREVSELLQISIKTIDSQMAIAIRKISQAINLKMRSRLQY